MLVLSLLGQESSATCNQITGEGCTQIIIGSPLSEAEIRRREEQEIRRKEEIRREQQQVDAELARRGWPRSREQEVRQLLELQKAAAAVAPKPGAGAALREEESTTAGDKQSQWLQHRLSGQSSASSSPLLEKNLPQDKKEEARREPVNEAIIACSKPDFSGRFRCLTPVDIVSGGPDDKDWQTPEAFVAWASSSCPAARRLTSTTHLVWGCGFGATGNANSMDRSAGVNVGGRQVFFCFPKETSCRRKLP